MNALQIFNFESQAVRSLLRNDEPWFVATDVCRILELSNTSKAVEHLDSDEKGITLGDTLGGNQEMLIVSESGLYVLIFKSRTPEAKRFRKWVTSVLLPTLRRTGRFVIGDDDEDLPSLAHGRLWGQPVAKINAAARMIGVAQRIYGPEAARALWEREKGLPKLAKLSVTAMTGRADDDATGCWKHLMRAAVGANRTLGSLIDLALHDRLAAKALRDYGLAFDPQEAAGHLAIANKHKFLASVFAATQWCDDWRLALVQMPGARPSKGAIGFGGANSRAVLIPREDILRLRVPDRH